VTYVLPFLFVLGVLVFIHELGHFLAARRVGIRVLTFSLGFGPKLVKVQRGDTEYCISALPLGGYVKMAGEAADEPRTGAPDEFLSKTKWQRFQVLIMGPVMNILLAIVVLTFVLVRGNQVAIFLDQPPVIGVITAKSPAATAGLQPGDRIVEVNGGRTDTWSALDLAVGTRANQDIAVTYERGGERRTVQMRPAPQGRDEFGDIGVEPDIYPLVMSTLPGDPADKAGLKPGDEVRAVDGTRLVFADDLREAISKKAGMPVDLTIARSGVEQHIRVTPIERDGGGKIGIVPGEPTKLVELNLFQAFGESVRVNYESTGLIFRTLGGLFTGQNSLRQLQGPIRIAQMSGEAAQISLASLLRFMAMLSLNLGLLNLLPVPILDGGHILIMAIEGLARRDFSMQVKERMLMAGFVVLMMLMVTVFYNDLAGLGAVQHLMKWRN
jgi:regulator of sigma E protease